MRDQYLKGKGYVKKILFFFTGFLVFFMLCNSMIAQGFDFSIRASWVKADVTKDSRDIVIVPKNYSNGFELGPMANYRPKVSPFAFNAGLMYSAIYYEKYNLNFLNTPIGLNIEMGKKAGAIFGIGIKGWYLLNVPDEFLA